jgi:hypothetical protein
LTSNRVTATSLTAEVQPASPSGSDSRGQDELRALIERIVREALAGQRSIPKPAASPFVATTEPHAVKKRTAPAGPAFSGAILAAEQAETLPRDTTVSIAAATVVTPSARDVLQSRRVKLVRGGFVRHHLPQGGAIPVADVDGLRRCAVIARQLASPTIGEVRGMGLADLIQRVKETGLPGFVTANLPQQIVWQLHHESNLCAAQIADFQDVDSVSKAMRPQVWVIDMRRQSLSTAIGVVRHCLTLINELNAQGGRG